MKSMKKKYRLAKATIRSGQHPIDWVGGIPEHLLDPNRDRRPDSPEAKARRKKLRQKHSIPHTYQEIIIPSQRRIKDEPGSAAPDTETSDKPDARIADSKDQPSAE